MTESSVIFDNKAAIGILALAFGFLTWRRYYPFVKELKRIYKLKIKIYKQPKKCNKKQILILLKIQRNTVLMKNNCIKYLFKCERNIFAWLKHKYSFLTSIH